MISNVLLISRIKLALNLSNKFKADHIIYLGYCYKNGMRGCAMIDFKHLRHPSIRHFGNIYDYVMRIIPRILQRKSRTYFILHHAVIIINPYIKSRKTFSWSFATEL